MTINIKKIDYLIPPKDLVYDILDVIITLEVEGKEDPFGYFVEITTPEFLHIIMGREKSSFLSPDYPYLIVTELTDDIIQAAIEAFIYPQDSDDVDEELFWLKLYNIMPSLTMEDLKELEERKLQERIKWKAEVEAELEDESDTKN